MRQSTPTILLAALLIAAPAAAAGLNQGLAPASVSELLPWATLDPSIPTQAAVTGVEPGERPLRPEEALEYFRRLADHSERARLIEYARSYEGRPLVILAVGDEKAIADLDNFKQQHADLLDPRKGKDEDAAGRPAVAWMAYGIHGDELSSTDAAATLAYWLVAGEDERARTLREKLVILIDPCENPDGRARYLAQTMSFAHRTANPDQDDLSHAAVWPWGRGNHYLFDLNRDWFTQVHPESARSTVIAGWLPQLLVDSHEMGDNATYLFPPPRHPFNPHLPENARRWERVFSDDQAEALDNRGYPYFTGEWNEEFFPGYGSSWAAYHGSIGILYEMSGTSGTVVRKRGGTLRTFVQAVEHQLTSSVANLESLAVNSEAVLKDQIAARREAVKAGSSGNRRAWILVPDRRHPERLGKLAALITRQGIEVHALTGEAVKLSGARDARTGAGSDLQLTAGTLMVRLDQPGGGLARAILDPHVPMESVFLSEEREYLEKGKGSRLYETTAWSLILGHGVPAYWTGAVPGGSWQVWEPAEGAAVAGRIASAYHSVILDGDPDRSPAVLSFLLQNGVVVRIADRPFTVGGRQFQAGAMVARREGNIDSLTDVLNQAGERFLVELFPVTTSRSEAGPDLGGSHFPVLVPPRVGVLTGMPVSPSAYGSIWHLLDQDLDLRFSSLDVGRFGATDLSRYNVLVFPPVMGGTGMYRQLLGTQGVSRLKSWVEAGGTAIGIGGGARMLADVETGLTRARFRSQSLENFPPPVFSIPASAAEAAGRPTALGLRVQTSSDKDKDKDAPAAPTGSPYDVAPILGSGARPFAAGVDLGTELAGEPVAMKDWVQETLAPGKKNPDKEDLEKADRRLRLFMPQGVLLRSDLDPEFWMNFGMDRSITVWFGRNDSLIASPPVTVAARFPAIDRLHLGGLLWPEAAARMARTGYATRESLGRGQIILFADHPAYRRWMRETERMLSNAILYGPGLGTRWSSPW